MTSTLETHSFQAETKQLMDLMIHSLYTNKEIFLRELISNASDALDRLRFESLTRPELLEDGDKLEIRLEPDAAARTLTISDNGIGMNRQEVMDHIGTIARSGTRELRDKSREATSPQAMADLIGQFGVGFYSAFMAADRVTVVTRRAGETGATRWESSGDGTYTLGETERPKRGTSITLHLKPVNHEEGIEDFTDAWRIESTIKRYSDFISYPIVIQEMREEVEKDAEGQPKPDGVKTRVLEDKTLNSMKPIWTRPAAEVSDSDYHEFYKHLAHDWTEPLKVLPLKAEGVQEYEALLFIPAHAPFDLYFHTPEMGLKLYSRRVMIMERCEDLVPRYLRWIRGVVDSSDLPLNISRQRLQQDRHITQIRRWLTRKALDGLRDMQEKEPEKYLKFWGEFGAALKEGIGSDSDNKDKIIGLLMVQSSHDPEKLTTLKDYVARMKEDQTEIFYLTGESRKAIENSPHLEAAREKGYEVVFLTDPVDELVTQYITEFEGKKLKSVGRGIFQPADEEQLKEKQADYKGLLERMREQLSEHVKEVRLSTRLTSSPACLVVDEHDYSPQFERLLRREKSDLPKQRRVLELNPEHPIVKRMLERYKTSESDTAVNNTSEMLFSLAVLAEGSELPDPVRFQKLTAELIEQSL
ncbi:MAG: molecular chaperone HtpG [Acidobacteriota bacterium]|nr:molecular chaperone HtpG [Acidobacteriota bacterium]